MRTLSPSRQFLAVGAIVVVVAGGSVVYFANRDDSLPQVAVGSLTAMRAAAVELCPEGGGMSVPARIGTGIANAFEGFDGDVAEEALAKCGPPATASTLGRTVGTISFELRHHSHDREYLAFALEVSSVVEEREPGLSWAGGLLQPDTEVEVDDLIAEGRFVDAARSISQQSDVGAASIVVGAANDALGDVLDHDDNDAFKRSFNDQLSGLKAIPE